MSQKTDKEYTQVMNNDDVIDDGYGQILDDHGEDSNGAGTLWWVGIICVALAILFAFTLIMSVLYLVGVIIFGVGWFQYRWSPEPKARRFATLHCWSFFMGLGCCCGYLLLMFLVPSLVVLAVGALIGIIYGIAAIGHHV